ncbi:hypothetical protein EON63_06660 [archaeon]|nr:MAG: hypothetical protein EON63_06660 [archaeon]
MRELEVGKREAILGEVQRLLMDKSFCPFYFKPDFARVISGMIHDAYTHIPIPYLYPYPYR